MAPDILLQVRDEGTELVAVDTRLALDRRDNK